MCLLNRRFPQVYRNLNFINEESFELEYEIRTFKYLFIT